MDIKNSNICYNNIKGDNNRKIYYVSGSSGSGISNMTLKQFKKFYNKNLMAVKNSVFIICLFLFFMINI